jgi:hypothetical protein
LETERFKKDLDMLIP